MPEYKIIIILAIITIPAIMGGIVTAPSPTYFSVIHTLCIGFVVSSIFYLLVIFIPARQRRSLIRRSLDKQYRYFKLSCISTFLIASNSQEYHPHEMLLNQEEFRRYFSNVTEEQIRWDAVATSLQENEYLLRDIIYEFDMLNTEIVFVRNNIDIHDEEVFGFLNNVSQIIYQLKYTQRDYDDIKSLCRRLWEIFSGSDFIKGYQKNDILQLMINRI